jgi:hypothetical protein
MEFLNPSNYDNQKASYGFSVPEEYFLYYTTDDGIDFIPSNFRGERYVFGQKS